MTHLAARFAADLGLASSRVIGSGTTLDTARFRTLLGTHLGIDPQHVHAYVLGEHGDSEVLAWSQVRVAGLPLAEYCAQMGITLDAAVREEIDVRVRKAAYTIIAGKGATYYGIGSAIARMAEIVLKDQRAALSVCTPQAELLGIRDVTVSMPNVLGGEGIIKTLSLPLAEDEQEQLRASALVVKEAIEALDL
jgi:L-lactate dehydrogenase